MTTAMLGIAVTSNADKAAIDLDRLTAAAGRAEAGVDHLASSSVRTAAATDQIRLNSANIAAQLQDVAVSAQMGMNPMMIALQQGTQLSAALGPGGLRGNVAALSAAFASIVNPVSLATIAIIGLGSFGLQALAGLLGETESATEALERHGEELSKVVAGYSDAEGAIKDFMTEVARLPRAAVQIELGGQLREMTAEVAAFRDRAASLGPVLSGSLNATDREIGELLSKFSDGRMSADDLLIEMTRIANMDFGPLGFGVRMLAEELLAGATRAAALENSLVAISHALAGTAVNGGLQMALSSSIEAQRSAQAHQIEMDAINAKTPAQVAEIARRRERLKLIDEEISETLRDQKVREAGELAFAQAAARGGREHDRWGNSVESFRNRIATQQMEIGLIGQSTFEIERQRAAMDLLNDAKRAGIPITDQVIGQINGMAAEYATATAELERITEAQKRQQEEIDFYKSTFRSFVSDFRAGLREGEDAWTALGQAGVNALDKIADRALSMAADGIFDLIFGAVTGGIIGGLGGGFSPQLGQGLTGANVFGGSNGFYMGGFASGGYGVIPGSGGTDSVLAYAKVSPGEPYAFGPAAMQGIANDNAANSNLAPISMTVNIYQATDPAAVGREIEARVPNMIARYNANNRRR